MAVDELELGLSAVAAPVRDGSGSVAALSISGPSMRLELERLLSYGKLLCEAAGRLANGLERPYQTHRQVAG